ncbi:MAG: hypothetical protein RMM53_10765 [Bacteroidia bacterium]|nr:hypothetical protein [Bacteroidia bacterium]MDW8334686.1 hypothetical protein [Bacteroidia bacterium]
MEEKFVVMRNAAGILQFFPEAFYRQYFRDGKPILTEDGRAVVSELAELSLAPEFRARIEQFPSGPAVIEIEKTTDKIEKPVQK